MAKGINRLDPNVSNLLRSQVLTVSLSSAIREVVQNSVDAGASRVEVLFDPFEMSFMVIDNGRGMDCHDLDQVGCQYFTSKITELDDLTHLKTFGFRGEALFCISNVSHVTMVSKRADCNCSWIRNFPSNSKALKGPQQRSSQFLLEPLPRTESGTITLVRDLLYNVPVRRKLLRSEPVFKTFLAIKEDMFQILILHSETDLGVSYLDLDGRHNTLICSSNITADMNPFVKLWQSFRNVFGCVVPMEMFTKVSVEFKDISITGLISKSPIRFKEYQFIYFNGRRYANQSFKRSIDGVFQEAGFGASGFSNNSIKAVGKSADNHPVIILNVRCPQAADELMQDSAKNIFSSFHTQILHPLILKVVKSFLAHQGYTADHTITTGIEDVNDAIQASSYNQKNTVSSPKAANTIFTPSARMATEKPGSAMNESLSSAKTSNLHVGKPISNKVRIEKLNNLLQLTLIAANGQKNYHDDRIGSHWNSGKPEVVKHIEFNLKRSHLAKADVISQIDNKFILLKMPPVNPLSNPLLVIADQHACDERIKLENNMNEFLCQVVLGTLIAQPVSNCDIDIDVTEGYLFKHYEEEFERWAIFYDVKMTNLETCRLAIKSLPEVLNVKANGDKIFLQNALLQTVHDLKNSKKLPITKIRENHLLKTSKKTFEWWQYAQCMPAMFQDIFKSRACRSAIMFGHTLSMSECISLVRQLAKCHLPFQCAHGRPSAIPLLELTTDVGPSDGISRDARKSYLDYNIDS